MISEGLLYINNNLHAIFGKNYNEMINTFLIFITLGMFYSFITYAIKKTSWKTDKKRRVSINSRNALFFLFIICALFIWSGELKTMILTITALVAALLIAFKEMFLSLLGSFLISSGKIYILGEYIEIDGIKGKVIDKNFIYTKILVTDNFQTKEMSIPNILFVTSKITNLSKYGKFQSYTLKLALPSLNNIESIAQNINNLATTALEKHSEKYKEYFKNKKLNDIFFEIPEHYFSIEYDFSDSKNYNLKLHYISHPLDQKEIEQMILNGYIKSISDNKGEENAN